MEDNCLKSLNSNEKETTLPATADNSKLKDKQLKNKCFRTFWP